MIHTGAICTAPDRRPSGSPDRARPFKSIRAGSRSLFLLDTDNSWVIIYTGIGEREARRVADQQGGWTVEWYRTRSGGEAPARSFVDGLTDRNRDDAAALLELLVRRGNQLRPPQSRALGGNLFELRGHQGRVFSTFRQGRRVVILDV